HPYQNRAAALEPSVARTVGRGGRDPLRRGVLLALGCLRDPVRDRLRGPEYIGLHREGDQYPPLTHVIRHFVAGWLAFPLLYGMLGTWGGKALDFPRWWAIGALCAGLGWITHHFMFTYIDPDQFPRDPNERPEDLDPRKGGPH